MCIICLEFQRHRDLDDARRMVAAARREPGSIERGHLDEVEAELAQFSRTPSSAEGNQPAAEEPPKDGH